MFRKKPNLREILKTILENSEPNNQVKSTYNKLAETKKTSFGNAVSLNFKYFILKLTHESKDDNDPKPHEFKYVAHEDLSQAIGFILWKSLHETDKPFEKCIKENFKSLVRILKENNQLPDLEKASEWYNSIPPPYDVHLQCYFREALVKIGFKEIPANEKSNHKSFKNTLDFLLWNVHEITRTIPSFISIKI